MNNKSFYLIFGCLIFVISIFTTSCSKEEKEVNSIPAADMAIYNKIQAFKNRMSHPLKTNPPMSIDSAKWYIESTLNVTYGSGSFAFNEIHIDTFRLCMTVNNGVVEFINVQSFYEELLADIKNQYHSLSVDSKQFVFCNVKPVVVGLKSGVESFEVISGVAEGYYNIFNFNATDYWFYGQSMGKCSPFSGSIGRDAAKEIANKIHIRKGVPSGNYSVIDHEFVNIIAGSYPNPNDPIPGDNLRDYLMFRVYDDGNSPNVDLCINPFDMDFYLNGTEHVVYNIEKPSGKSFIDISLSGDYTLWPVWPYATIYFHHGQIHYGVLVANPDPPADL